MSDIDSLFNLLDGLDKDIATLSARGGKAAPPPYHAPPAPVIHHSSESAISDSFFNTPDLPFEAVAEVARSAEKGTGER